jgi:hypothetical protein
MRLDPLGSRLAYVEPCPDESDGRRTGCRYFVGELRRRSRVQRIDPRCRVGCLGYRRYLR